jgi:hypothetical protein
MLAVASAQPPGLAFKVRTLGGIASLIIDKAVPNVDVNNSGFFSALAIQFVQIAYVASRFRATNRWQPDPNNRHTLALKRRDHRVDALHIERRPLFGLEINVVERIPRRYLRGARRQHRVLDGVSMVYTFDDAKAPTRHNTQYFEIAGNRGLYEDGWMASTTPLRLPWQVAGVEPDPDDFPWELYNVAQDFSQSNNLAKQNPKKLQDLEALCG